MSGTPDGFVPRPYPDIVRDLLTALTGGVVREAVTVPPGDVLVLDRLAERPLRRVSHLAGDVEVETVVRDPQGNVVLGAGGTPEITTARLPYRFTELDFELIATGADPGRLDAIRFRPTGRRPPVGSTVTVNYYPAAPRPAPVTDLTVGSVARTLMESVAREVAVAELLMEQVYRSAFVETAEGVNLDRVVALVGVVRRPAGVPTVRVRIHRAEGSTGRITVPAATVVADREGNRYATVAPLVLEPGELSREAVAAGTSRTTAAVEEGRLTELEVLIAGVARVTNDGPAAPAAAPESDDELRARARGALAVAARGTLDAIRFGLLAITGVTHVAITEFPAGVPGEIRVDVAYADPADAAVQAEVAERLEDLRPAGVRVLAAPAAAATVRVQVELTLAGAGVAPADLPALTADVERRLVTLIEGLPPGGTLRQGPAVIEVLADPRIADAAVSFTLAGSPAPTLTAPAGTVLRAERPLAVAVATETGDDRPGTEVALDVVLPVHLAAGVTAAEAEAAVRSALEAHARQVGAGASITLDALLAAARDDTRFAAVRAEAAAVVEAGERFLTLADGAGGYPLVPGDRVVLRDLRLEIREGGA